MVRETNTISISSSDSTINAVLRNVVLQKDDSILKKEFYYNQNEDMFIILSESIHISSLPIHHPIEQALPPHGYVEIIKSLCETLMRIEPQLLAGATWFFDPKAIHRPSFYKIYQWQDFCYVQLIRLDLTCRTLECIINEQGTNDTTHAYTTNRLYFESDYYPLRNYISGRKELELYQTIPTTWRGESGQGYMVHGIWMDSDINKFFTKLILPSEKRNHPYYPITCKYRCISMSAINIQTPALLHSISEFLKIYLDDILSDLQNVSFSESMVLFKDIKNKMPENLGKIWEDLIVTPYLNEHEQKEYKIIF